MDLALRFSAGKAGPCSVCGWSNPKTESSKTERMWILNWPLNFASICVSLIIPADSKTFPIQGRRWRHLNWLTNCRCWRGYRGPTGYEYSPGTNCCPEILNWSYIQPRYGLNGPGIEFRWWWWGGGGEIFRTRPDWPWGPPSVLYNGYWVIPGGKAAGAWRWPPTIIQRRG
jgi:hypothetical protein